MRDSNNGDSRPHDNNNKKNDDDDPHSLMAPARQAHRQKFREKILLQYRQLLHSSLSSLSSSVVPNPRLLFQLKILNALLLILRSLIRILSFLQRFI
jgi:hypothetical protein